MRAGCCSSMDVKTIRMGKFTDDEWYIAAGDAEAMARVSRMRKDPARVARAREYAAKKCRDLEQDLAAMNEAAGAQSAG